MQLFLARVRVIIAIAVLTMSGGLAFVAAPASAEAYTTSKFDGEFFNVHNSRHSTFQDMSAFTGDETASNTSVFYYDGSALHQIYHDPNSIMESVVISGNHIAWEASQPNTHAYQLYLYTISTGQVAQVAAPAFDVWQMDLDGNFLAWSQDTTGTPATGEGHQQIFLYDINNDATTQITDDNFGNSNPQLTDTGLYWIGGAQASYSNITRLDLQSDSTELIAGSTGPYPSPIINQYYAQGNSVVWTETSNSSPYPHVYWYDGSTTTQLTDNGQNNAVPIISDSGQYIDWTQYPAHAIYQYDTTTASTTELSANADAPMFNGNYQAWNQSPVGGGLPQIILKNLSTGVTTQLTSQAIQDQNVILAQNYVVYCGGGCYVTKFTDNLGTPELTSNTTLTNTYPTLTWSSVPFAAQYMVFRDGVNIGSVAGTSYSDSGAPEGHHTYYIEAVNNDVSSGPSNSVNVTVDKTGPVVSVTPAAGSTLSGTVTFNITVTDNNALDTTKNKSIWVYLYDTAGTQKSSGAKVNLSNGSGTFTVDTTKLSNGNANLDVGIVSDAAGNASGRTDTYFRNYTINN